MYRLYYLYYVSFKGKAVCTAFAYIPCCVCDLLWYFYLMRTVFLSVTSTACSWENSSVVSWWLFEDGGGGGGFENTAAAPPVTSAKTPLALTPEVLMLSRDMACTISDKRVSSPSINFLTK